MPRHVALIPVRWADLDAYGHVNNVVFLRYLQEARVDMLFVADLGSGEQGLAQGIVVARHEIGYRAPLRFQHRPIRVETWVREIRSVSFTLGYEIVGDSGTIHAVASTMLVPYDLEQQHPRRLAAGERALLEDYQVDGGPLPKVVGIDAP